MEERQFQSGGRPRSILLVCLLAAAVGIYMFLQWLKPPNKINRPGLVVAGQSAPDFALPLLSGELVRISDYRGKIVFLNIWATWCAPCQLEMPSMEILYQEMKNQPFEILAVSIDPQGAAVVKPFVKQYRLTFPVLLDVEAKVNRLYNTTGVPETFIIGKDGIIVSKFIGYRNWADPKVVRFLENLAQRP